VLGINPAQYAEQYTTLDPEQIVGHIRRHTRFVKGLWLENIPREFIADAMQEEAHRLSAETRWMP
jgi:hypothetical protein